MTPAPFRRTVLAFGAAGVVAFAELYGVQALLPSLGRDLALAPPDAALVQSSAALGLAVAVIPWSLAARRWSRGALLRVSLVATVVLGPVVATLASFEWLVGVRALHGAVIAGIPALALSHLGEILDRERAATAAGWYVGGTAFGGLSGRLIASLGGALGDWRTGLVAVSLLTVVVAAVFLLIAPRAAVRAPVAGATARALRDPRTGALFAIALLLMGAFVALYNYFGFRITSAPFALPDAAVGMTFLVYLAGAVTATRVGALARRWGRRRVLLVGATAFGLGTLVTLPDLMPLAIGGLALATGGFFAVHGLAAGWVAELGAGSSLPSALYTLAYYTGAGGLGWLAGFLYVGGGWAATVAGILAAVAASLVVIAVLLHDDAPAGTAAPPSGTP